MFIIFEGGGAILLTSERIPFPNNVCSIVINEVWFNQRIQNLCSPTILSLNLFAG